MKNLLQSTKFPALILSVWLLTLTVFAAPGDLDPTFGNRGLFFSASYTEYLSLHLQPDGKILIAGFEAYLYGDSHLLRYNADGTPDRSFGANGVVQLPFIPGATALQSDGKILVGCGNAICRYNPNGTLDTTIELVVGGRQVNTLALTFAPDGKIILTGAICYPNCGTAAIIRYNPDWTLDTSFGNNGIVLTAAFQNYTLTLVRPNGGLLYKTGSLIVSYHQTGTLDSAFGASGFLLTGVTGKDAALQADGKIVVIGRISNTLSVIKRFNANGTLDTGFGTDGVVYIPDSSPYSSLAQSLAIQKNGKILTAGSQYSAFNFFEVARFNSNGTADTKFGVNGIVMTRCPLTWCEISALKLQSDGKIVGAGIGYLDAPHAVLLRYLGDRVNAASDFDGDGKSDIAVFRPSDSTWYLNQTTRGFSTVQFGLSTDRLTPADFDGDGRTDIAVFRDGIWYLLRSQAGFGQIQFGLAGDIPTPADFDGDGSAELAVYRSGMWWTFDLTNSQVNTIQFGYSTDKPIAADYDGDGRADQAVYRNGEWHLNLSNQGYRVVSFGLATDKAVPSDYDGDGKTDVAVFRPSEGNWYVRQSATGILQVVNWGLASDTLVPADFDGDGQADMAVYRDGIWYIRQTRGGISYINFGLGSDAPTNQVQ